MSRLIRLLPGSIDLSAAMLGDASPWTAKRGILTFASLLLMSTFLSTSSQAQVALAGISLAPNTGNLASAGAAGVNSLAIGYGTAANGTTSTVIGTLAKDNGNAGSTVVGDAAAIGAGLAGSNVAIGQGSIASTGANVAYNALGLRVPQTSVGEVSVGADTGLRTVTHVAAGLADSDAVNVGQLRGVTATLGESVAVGIGGGSVYNPALFSVSAPSFNVQKQTYASVGLALGALDGAVDEATKYYKVNSTAAGSTAIGQDSVAAGPAAVASNTGSVAIGNGSAAAGRNSVALGAGSNDGGQSNVVSVGSVGNERRIMNVAPAAVTATSTEAVNGSQLYQTNTQLTALSHNSVKYDTAINGSTVSSITLNSDQGGPVIIHNLAPGVAANDAATVGQIQTASANSVQYTTVNNVRSNTVVLQGGSPGGVTISNVANATLGTDAVNLNQLRSYSTNATAAANAYTDQRISNLANLTSAQISQARSDAAGGAAIALAATGVRYDDRPGKTSIGGATSYYHDQMGIAFGVGHTSEDGRIRMNASVSASPTMTRPDVGAVVGASYSIN